MHLDFHASEVILNLIVIFIVSLLAVVLGITIHEFSHALSADLLGDPTARYMGRLTLNPVAHFDPIGGLMILVSSVTGLGFGWGKPVPVNPVNLRFGPRVGLALTAFAGPFSNIVLATVIAAPLRLDLAMPPLLASALGIAISVNIGLAVFNLLPLPPLDGFSVVRGILAAIRTRWAYDIGGFMDRMLQFGPMLLFGVLMLDRALSQVWRGPGIIWTVLGPLRNLLLWLILGS